MTLGLETAKFRGGKLHLQEQAGHLAVLCLRLASLAASGALTKKFKWFYFEILGAVSK